MDLKSFTSKAYVKGSLLLRRLNAIDSSKMKEQLVFILEAWSNTKDLMEDYITDLPTPVLIVKTWVEVALLSIYFIEFSVLQLLSFDCCMIYYACSCNLHWMILLFYSKF